VRVSALREDVGRNEVIVDALLTNFINGDNPAQCTVIEANRLKLLAEIDRVRTDIEERRTA
jgi:hypothetical protein